MKGGVEKILKKVNSDYIDILILGWFNNPPSGRILEKAYKLREHGKIIFIGMSGHNRKTFGKIARDTNSSIDVFMTRYNAVNTGAEEDIFPYLQEENCPGITTYTATCRGKLLNPKKLTPGESPLKASDCYRFALSHPKVDTCLMGPKDSSQLEEGLLALELGSLSEEEMQRIRNIGTYIYGS